MKKCPRCHSSMILSKVDVSEGVGYTWHCLGCGRELWIDPKRQVEDERIRQAIQEVALHSGQRAR